MSRLVIVGLSGLVAMHISMLAGHGHGHDPFAGMRGADAHASTAASPSLTAATDGDQDADGMHLELTVACLAVVAGFLLLQPKQRRQTVPGPLDERSPSWYPARVDPARRRMRSLEKLSISLT